VSTNIAEASITVHGIAYVVDSGRAKKMMYNHDTRVSTLASSWISQAAANQRKGRAGRTRAGKCFRMYSEKQFEQQMEKQEKPEILRGCLEEAVLKLIGCGVDVSSQ
jgi:pre-mRNA-splicing factor ATP-dependent RNA helicase DHX15/PRP43